MMTFESIKTIRDLVTEAGKAYENRVYLRTLRNNMIHDTTFGQFSLECNAIASVLGYVDERELVHRDNLVLV